MLHHELEIQLKAVVAKIVPDADLASVLVRPCPDPKFGDYQSSALMAIAKARKMNPRQLATQVVEQLDVSRSCEKVEIAGPGFLNFRIKHTALNETLNKIAGADQLVEPAAKPKTYVIDFSSPNVAKPMHVGHIRSTGIGDAIQRVLRLLGHNVITDNHIGDWGTQFGILLVGWATASVSGEDIAEATDPIERLNFWYKELHAACSGDEGAVERLNQKLEGTNLQSSDNRFHQTSLQDWVRQELVRLQQGKGQQRQIWESIREISQKQFDEIYSRLGVKFDQTLGESFYNPQLAGVVEDLQKRGIARESEGAVAVFSDGSMPPKEDPFLVSRDGEWVPDPALIRKRDGGFNYMTTDLATIDYRLKTWSPDEIVYVVDDRQGPHFKKLFLTFARWQPDAAAKVKLRHVGFGKILGDDGKPFKTRSGDTVKLGDLLDEAEQRARKIVEEKNQSLSEAERREVARVVGIGAIKYADLAPNRQTDYVFSWDKMLAFQGNTAPYLQYAYTRIRSIFRKAAEDGIAVDAAVPIAATEPDELALAKHLLNFGLTLEYVVEDYRPNYLCSYLYELAGFYSRFYESCPVLKSDEPQRGSRLRLCELAGRILKQGLNALGIETLEQM
ncbi:arginine--tRNA ligase [bacterium]|nr:arginine--tRNA ligase [bacterium]